MPPLSSRKLAVLDAANEHVCWLDEHAARDLIKRGEVELLWSKRRVRALRLIDGSAASAARLRGLAPVGTRYSHKHETPDNPANVWTLRHLPAHTRTIFRAVVDGCLAAA